MAEQIYQALYRRWRPGRFGDFVGQSHVVVTLSNAIAAGRMAHAYLFTGPRGTGKTSIAKIFAKALNCEAPQGAEPCDHCPNCLRIDEGSFLDVFEIDAASNRGIDEIRDLREKVKFSPAEGKYKIYIIDEVHMLTTEAFNALLKTLEEPPKFVLFILATTEAHKIPATILSRCQRFDFKRFTVTEIKGRLEMIVKAEGVKASPAALELIAIHAEGGMRDAVGLLEQSLAHSEGSLEETNVRAILGLIDQEEIVRLAQTIKERDTKAALEILNSLTLGGKDLYQFGRSLVSYLRELLLTNLAKPAGSAEYAPGDLVHLIEALAVATNEVKKSQQSALPLELALIKLTAGRSDYRDLEARVAKLEALLQGGQSREAVPVRQATAVAQPRTAVAKAEVVAHTRQQPELVATTKVDAVAKSAFKSLEFDWEGFLEAVKKRKRTLAALIQEGKPRAYSEGQLVVEFPPHLKFHLDNLSQAENKQLLESILSDFRSEPSKLACVPQSEAKQLTPAPVAGEAAPDLVAKTIAIFGGEARPIIKEEETK